MIRWSNKYNQIAQLLLCSAFYNSTNRRNDNHFKILGLHNNADQSQIKKAYYKLAHQYHPDKNSSSNAKELFDQINYAYRSLIDSIKIPNNPKINQHQQYSNQDQEQHQQQFTQQQSKNYKAYKQQKYKKPRKRGFTNGMNIDQLFEEIFGSYQPNKAPNKARKSQSNNSVSITIELSFLQAVNGATKVIHYSKKQTCTVCKGTKVKPGQRPSKCGFCKGKGVNRFKQGPFIFQQICQKCQGSGKKIKTYCKNCSGVGIQSKKTNQSIKFPKGISHGTNLKFKGRGNLEGDLIVNVKVKKHPTIRRQQNDAHSEALISITDAVLGTQFQIQTIYGMKKKLKIPEGSQDGDKIQAKRQGFYSLNSSEKGSHIITIKVKVPTNSTEEQKNIYRQLRSLKSNL